MLICLNYILLGLNKVVVMWCRTCIPCQKTKVHLLTKSPLMRLLVRDERFAHIYLDIIGVLPLVRRFRYCLTMIDGFTRLLEAVSILDVTVSTVAQAFVQT